MGHWDTDKVRQVTTEFKRDSWRLDSLDRKTREANYRRSCIECLMIAPLFGIFMLLQYTHMSHQPSYLIERVLKFEFLSKRFGNFSYTVVDVHDAALFWEWFEMMLEETVAIQHDQLGHTLPRSEWGYITGYNRVIGGVRLEQDRGTKGHCEGSPGEVCYTETTSVEPFGYPPCGDGHNGACYDPQHYVGSVNVDSSEGFVLDNYTGHFEMWLDTTEPRHVLKKRVEYLEDRHWIDKQTRKVVMELLVRNDQFESLVSEVIFEFRFDLTGYIRETAIVETIPADPYSTNVAMKISLGALYVLMNLVLLVHLLRSFVRRYWRRKSLWHACHRTLGGNAVEVATIVITVVQIALWAVYVPSVMATWGRIEGLQRPSSEHLHNNSDDYLWQDYHHEIADIEKSVKQCVGSVKLLREFSSLILLCLLLRNFKVWEGIPAFATVTRTLAMSASRLGAVMVSAGTLLALFSGAAMLNYGTQLDEFHTIQRSIQETATIAISGEPKAYDKMSAIDPIFAAIWFWGLIAVMFMAVLNMVLGILVDAASAAGGEKAPIGLVQQMFLTFRSVCRQMTTHKEKRDEETDDEEHEPDTEPRALSPPEVPPAVPTERTEEGRPAAMASAAGGPRRSAFAKQLESAGMAHAHRRESV